MKVYPFAAKLVAVGAVAPFEVELVRLTTLGFLIQFTHDLHWKMGEKAQIQFDLPMSEVKFDEPVALVKSHLKWSQAPGKERQKLQIFEMHFLSLASSKKSVIEKFVAQTITSDNAGS